MRVDVFVPLDIKILHFWYCPMIVLVRHYQAPQKARRITYIAALCYEQFHYKLRSPSLNTIIHNRTTWFMIKL